MVLLLALGCQHLPGGTHREPPGDSAPADTDRTDTGPHRELVDVSHTRELRGVWVATVANIDFPSRTGLTADAQKAELDGIVDNCADVGINAIFFQIRPEGDALYSSEIEPWSRYLTGTQGRDPGYDPLDYLIGKAHARGIEVHGWINPYRASASQSYTTVSPNMAQVWPEYAYDYGTGVWMDPGATEVQDRDVEVIRDVVDRYDLDGIHFDDYFYPYPDGNDFPDDATYRAYTNGGGTLSHDDWRRDNVNTLVQRVHDAVAADEAWVRFGISPFGIYRPGQPEGISGLDQYAEIYSDPPHWMDEGWVDYLAPQLYWPHTQTAQAYGPLAEWWTDQATGQRSMFIGNYLSKLGTSSSWTLDEFRTQVQLQRDAGATGHIWFSYAPIDDDTDGIRAVLRDELYATPALPPPVSEVVTEAQDPPDVTVSGLAVTLAGGPRGYVVYRAEGSGFVIDRILPMGTTSATLDAGRWAITAVSRGDVESRGVVVELEE